MADLRITHLYPELLTLNGEKGNIAALVKRANWCGLEAEVTAVEHGHHLPRHTDILVIGAGTNSAAKLAAEALQKHAREIANADYQVLALGSGWDILAESFTVDGEAVPTLGLTATNHTATGTHLAGEVVLGDGANPLAGFINTDRVITGIDESLALGRVSVSDDERLVGLLEGYFSDRILAARLQGPLLPMNPLLADELLMRVLGAKYQVRADAADQQAKLARQAIAGRLNFKP